MTSQRMAILEDILSSEEHRSFVPDFGVYLTDYDETGQPTYHSMSR